MLFNRTNHQGRNSRPASRRHCGVTDLVDYDLRLN